MDIITVEYKEGMGKNPLTDEMRAVLSGKTLEEQLDYFFFEEDKDRVDYSYGEESGGKHVENKRPLKDALASSDCHVTELIVCEGYIVGIVIRVCELFHWNEYMPYLLNKWACTYFASEDDGTGRSTLECYARIVFGENTLS